MKYFKRLYSSRIVIFSALILLAVIVSVSLNYRIFIEKSFQRQIETNLHQIAAQTTTFVETELIRREQILNYLSYDISKNLVYGKKYAIQKLAIVAKQYNFKTLGIVYENGIGFTSKGQIINLNNEEEYNYARKIGKPYISNLTTDKTDNQNTITYFVPLLRTNLSTQAPILFGSIKTEDIQQFIPDFIFEGKNYFYLIERNGNIVASSAHQVQDQKHPKNLFDTMYEACTNNRYNIESLTKKIRNGKVGYIKFENKINKYLYYYPTKINNWYICSIVPLNNIDTEKKEIADRTLLFLFIIILSAVSFFILIAYILVKSKKELETIAYIDFLTGGLSYAKFCNDAQKSIAANLKTKNMAMISINIDNFKTYSNSLGKKEGNKLLKFVWQTIEDRKTGAELHTRRFEDKFYFLVYFTSEESLIDRVTIIYDIIKNYNSDSKNRYYIRSSFGIYVIPNKAPAINKIIEYSDFALKMARTKHGNFYSFFDSHARMQVSKKTEIEKNMFQALKNKEFKIYYQPMFEMQTGKITAAEAFVKWIKSDGTEIPYEDFQSVFEKNFFITSINKYTFANVCRQQKTWIKTNIKPVKLSVNLSKLNFYDSNFITVYKKILNEYNVPPELVTIEITEDVFVEDIDKLYDNINELKKTGFSVIIHILGSGYSSLEILKKISIDTVKFNKNFIADINKEKSKKIIVNMINLAHSLDIKVACEDITSESEYKILKDAGCDIAQGPYLSDLISGQGLEKIGLMSKIGGN